MCQTIILTNTQWKHTHTQRIKVHPQLLSPKPTEEEKSVLISKQKTRKMTHLWMPTASQAQASRDSLENWEQRGRVCPEICQPLQDGYWLTGKEFLCHFDGSPVEHGIGSQNAAERHSFSLSKHITAHFTSGCAQNQTIRLGIRYQGDGNTAQPSICQPYAAFRRLLEWSEDHDCLLRKWSLPI